MARDRSVVSSVQYPMAESDGRGPCCWLTPVAGTTQVHARTHTHTHRWIHSHSMFVQMKEVVDGCDA